MIATYRALKAQRPVRHAIAVTAYRAIWWPVVAVLLPFALIGALVDWLSWTAFPWVAKTFRPVGGAAHSLALWVGNRILGTENPK